MIYRTPDGGRIEVTRLGGTVDLHYRDADGRTVATVEMTDTEAAYLLAELEDQ